MFLLFENLQYCVYYYVNDKRIQIWLKCLFVEWILKRIFLFISTYEFSRSYLKWQKKLFFGFETMTSVIIRCIRRIFFLIQLCFCCVLYFRLGQKAISPGYKMDKIRSNWIYFLTGEIIKPICNCVLQQRERCFPMFLWVLFVSIIFSQFHWVYVNLEIIQR